MFLAHFFSHSIVLTKSAVRLYKESKYIMIVQFAAVLNM